VALRDGAGDPLPPLTRVFGERLARRVLRAAGWRVLRNGRKRAPELEAPPHARRICAYAVMIAAELQDRGSGGWKACTSRLFRGRTYRMKRVGVGGQFVRVTDREGQGRWLKVPGQGTHDRVYVPAAEQGGLAARLGVCAETVRLWADELQHGQIFSHRQPKGEEDRDRLVGQSGHAYAVYKLEQPCPRELQEALARWHGKPLRRAQSTRALDSSSAQPCEVTDGAGEDTSSDVPSLASLLAQIAETRGPPSG